MLRVAVLIVSVGLCVAVPKLELQSWTAIPDGAGTYAPFSGTADKIALDEKNHYLYVIGGKSETLHILDIDNHTHPTIVYDRVYSEASDGVPTGIAFCRNNQVAEVAIAFADRKLNRPGHVLIYRAYEATNPNFQQLGRVATEPDPSAIKFDSQCRFYVACQGLAGLDGNTFTDPIPVVDIFYPGIDSWDKQTVNFLSSTNVTRARHIYTPSDIHQDLEPSDLVIDEDSEMVYVTFFKNNAIARFDMYNPNAGQFFYNLDDKNWMNSDIDTSDNDTAINMVRRNISSFHQAKRISLLIHNNQHYLLTANTGGIKQYTLSSDGVDFSDAIRAQDMDSALLSTEIDPTTVAQLRNSSEMGRLYISQNKQASDGWDTTYQRFNRIHAFGARSWSIYNIPILTEAYESGHDLAEKASLYNASVFNGDCFDENMSPLQHRDTRSDDMGVEPSAIDSIDFNGQTVVAVGSGRMGGIWLYTVSEGEVPGSIGATFNSYTRLGEVLGDWSDLYSRSAPGIQYIDDIILANDDHGHEILVACGSQMGAVAIFELVDGPFP